MLQSLMKWVGPDTEANRTLKRHIASREVTWARGYLRRRRTLSSAAATATGHHWSKTLCSQTVQQLSEQGFSLRNYRARHWEEKQNGEEKEDPTGRDEQTSTAASAFSERRERGRLRQGLPRLSTGPGCPARWQFLFATVPQASLAWLPRPH